MSESINESIKTPKEIDEEITNIMNALNAQSADGDAVNFYNGRLAALRWVLKLEP